MVVLTSAMDKRALIAGGTGRVGAGVAARLRDDGWAVLAAGRADGDLRTAAGARALVDRALGELGGLDLVVHAAAGPFEPRRIDQVSEAEWDETFAVTAKGSFFLAQAAAPALAEARGVVILVEDVAAYQAWPSFAPHCAAKAAQAMLTRVLARALAPDVRVCGIAPGAVAVEGSQEARRAAESLLGRIGSPDDVAAAVAYLAEAGFVTGTTLVVDGGRLLKTAGGGRP
jgi:pteridine reductase